MVGRRTLMAGMAAGVAARTAAQAQPTIRIGMLQDASGANSILGGRLSLECARQWIREGADAIMEFNNSAVALGVNTLIRDADRVLLGNNVGAAALSGKSCTPNETHWTFDTAMVVKSRGGTVAGEVALPLGLTDYASALLQAQSSGAKVVALALAGTDLQNCIKQAGEFGLMQGSQKVA